MYVNDNHGYLTYGTYSAAVGPVTHYYSWCGSYVLRDNTSFVENDGPPYPYLKTAKIDGCPSHASDTRLYYGPVDYAFGSVYLGADPTGGSVAPYLGAKMSQVVQPVDTALFWDSGRLNGNIIKRTFIGYPTSYASPSAPPPAHSALT